MPTTCAVIGCGSRHNRDYRSFYRMPRVLINGSSERIRLSSERRKKWIAALKRPNMGETTIKNARICDKHFLNGRPADILDTLNPDWIPNKLMGYKTKDLSLDRYNRQKKRLEASTSTNIGLKMPCNDDSLSLNITGPSSLNLSSLDILNSTFVGDDPVCDYPNQGRPSRDPQHPDYVPSLFSFNKNGIEEGRKRIERYERSQRRSQVASLAKTLTLNHGTLFKNPQESSYLSSQFSSGNESIDQGSGRQESNSEASSPEYEDMFECSCCKSVYSCKYYLQKHIKKKHPETVPLRNKPFKCSKCDRAYEESKNLKKHERIKHGAALAKRQARLICHFCSHPYATLDLLCAHISENHNVEIEREDMEFPDESDFLEWKNEEEARSNASFVKHGKSKPTKVGELSNYYFCKRSGFFRRRGSKYLMKSQGSCKIGGFCTAHMKVKVKVGGEHVVQYIKTHVGHSEELEHLWLTKAQKDALALKILSNVPFDEILNEVRSSPLTSLNRIHLLSRKDLYNIKKEYGLDNRMKPASQKVRTDPPITNHQKNIMKKMCELEARHQDSLSLCDQSVITYQDTFIVPSNTDDDEMYVVQLKNSDCNCKLRCKDCCVCVHMFTCSCPDAMKGNMCKHIHLVCRINKVSTEIEENPSDEAKTSAS